MQRLRKYFEMKNSKNIDEKVVCQRMKKITA